MSIQDNIRSGLTSGGGFAAGPRKNTPPQYADRQKQYFSEVTELFNQEYAKYADDYMTGTLEYFTPDGNPVSMQTTFRFANVVRPTAAIQRYFDDYKQVLFDSRAMDYIQPGAKLTTGGSVWLCFNPDNISSVTANGIFRRCNAVWNHLDYYGNVVSEPIVVEPDRANASTPDAQDSQMIARGYYNVVCQYNDFTRQINDNSRIVLGSKSYEVTGYGDFSTEFTGDYSSVRILKFTIRTETANKATDDMVNHVAEGLTFAWNAYLSGPDEWSVGQGTAQIAAITRRNGEQISGTTAHPILYQFEIDKPNVALLTPLGNEYALLMPLQAGTVTVTATLAQNPSVKLTKTVEITAASQCVRIVTGAPAAPLEPFQSAELTAYAYDNYGAIIPGTVVSFSASGAAEGSFRMTQNGNTATVVCYGYSETPLTVTASASVGGVLLSDSATIMLEGY